MGIATKIKTTFGGDDGDNSYKRTYQGDHTINIDKVLDPTDPDVITPINPGNFSSIRSHDVIKDPRYFSKDEANTLKATAKDKREGATQSKRAYSALRSIEKSDSKVHTEHRKYEKTVARSETDKQKSNASLARKLHRLRPEYTQMGKGLESAESKANARLLELKTKLAAVM